MNIRLLLAGALSVFSLNTQAQLTTGLVAHWPFSNTPGDSSGNNFHAVPVFFGYGPGKNGLPNTAGIFDGSKTYLTVPYQSKLNVTEYSICAIVKPMGYYSGDCQTNSILCRDVPNAAAHYGLNFSDNAYDNSCASADTSKNVFTATARTTNGAVSQWQYTPTIISNNWYTVIATYKNDTIRIFINGVLKSRFVSTSGALGTSAEGLLIGATYQGTTGAYPNWFKGYMDDLRLYNRVLSDDEIRYYSYGLYFKPKAPSVLCKNVTYTIPFNTVNDFAPGNSFTLQLSNASGSFASPTVLGVTTGTQSGTLTGVVPGTTPLGAGYKMRIVSSNPVTVSDTISVGIGVAATPPAIYSTVAPTNSIPAGTFTFFTAIGTNGGTSPTFQWKKNGIPIPGADTVTWGATAGTDYAHLDTITITVKSSTFCATPDTATSTPIVMYLTKTGIASINNQYNAGVYPNPANETMTINAENLENTTTTVSIYNTYGQLVKEHTYTVDNHQLSVSIATTSLPAGKYFLCIKNKTNTITLTATIIH